MFCEQCHQLNIISDGDAAPPAKYLAAIPGPTYGMRCFNHSKLASHTLHSDANDPGILVQIYWPPLTEYRPPGPPLWSPSSDSALNEAVIPETKSKSAKLDKSSRPVASSTSQTTMANSKSTASSSTKIQPISASTSRSSTGQKDVKAKSEPEQDSQSAPERYHVEENVSSAAGRFLGFFNCLLFVMAVCLFV